MEGIGSIEQPSQGADGEQDLSAEHELNAKVQVGSARLGGQDEGDGAAARSIKSNGVSRPIPLFWGPPGSGKPVGTPSSQLDNEPTELFISQK